MPFHFFFCNFVFLRPSPTRFSIVRFSVVFSMVREIVKLFEFGSRGLDIFTRFILNKKKDKAQVF